MSPNVSRFRAGGDKIGPGIAAKALSLVEHFSEARTARRVARPTHWQFRQPPRTTGIVRFCCVFRSFAARGRTREQSHVCFSQRGPPPRMCQRSGSGSGRSGGPVASGTKSGARVARNVRPEVGARGSLPLFGGRRSGARQRGWLGTHDVGRLARRSPSRLRARSKNAGAMFRATLSRTPGRSLATPPTDSLRMAARVDSQFVPRAYR